MDEKAIRVSNVGKIFKLPHEKSGSIKNLAINFYKRNKSYDLQKALNNISFDVKKGEFLGIVGRNGSGKSTLLKLLAGIYEPTKGTIQINGKLTPFIELGVGFSPDLTGRENVYLNGVLLGFNRKEMHSMYEDIVDFAELHKFMDQKLKNYSSGMQVRLAFSIATRVKSDILVLDEVLAVGDASFQRKCFNYFMHLKKTNQTVVLVTHDMEAIRQYCDRAIMIEEGKIVHEGHPEEIAQEYQKLFALELDKDHTKYKSDEKQRWGTEKIKITQSHVLVGEEQIVISAEFKANKNVDAPVVGFIVFGPDGKNILEGNTHRINYETKPMNKDQVLKIEWTFQNVLKNGEYDLTLAVCDKSLVEYYDWFNKATTFNVIKDGSTGGLIDPRITIPKFIVK